MCFRVLSRYVISKAPGEACHDCLQEGIPEFFSTSLKEVLDIQGGSLLVDAWITTVYCVDAREEQLMM
jgi:hypothetical protein